jgi:hypothetical protein
LGVDVRMIFLPRENIPTELLLIVKKVGEKEYEITTAPQLEPNLHIMLVMTLKKCAKDFIVKFAGGRLIISGENPDFNSAVECLKAGLDIPVIELEMT